MEKATKAATTAQHQQQHQLVLSQPSVQSLLAAALQSKAARTHVVARAPQQQVVCESRVVPSSAVVVNPIASRAKVPTIQIVPETTQQQEQQETHGVQDVLRFLLAEGEGAKYRKAMVDHDLAFLKQLELVKTV